MKIRSRGLGKRELEMNLREFTVDRDGTGVLLKGVTHAPITWETTVWVGPRDVGPILRMALHLAMLRLGLGWVLRRPDVPAEDHSGERMGQPAERAGQTGERTGRPRGRQPAATDVPTTDGHATVPEGEPATTASGPSSDGPASGPSSDGAASRSHQAAAAIPAPATPRSATPAAAATPAPAATPRPAPPRPAPVGQPTRPRPERLVRAEREPRPPRPERPPRPPRPPRPERPARPDQRERQAVGAAGGPPTDQAGGADTNGKEG